MSTEVAMSVWLEPRVESADGCAYASSSDSVAFVATCNGPLKARSFLSVSQVVVFKCNSLSETDVEFVRSALEDCVLKNSLAPNCSVNFRATSLTSVKLVKRSRVSRVACALQACACAMIDCASVEMAYTPVVVVDGELLRVCDSGGRIRRAWFEVDAAIGGVQQALEMKVDSRRALEAYDAVAEAFVS